MMPVIGFGFAAVNHQTSASSTAYGSAKAASPKSCLVASLTRNGRPFARATCEVCVMLGSKVSAATLTS